MNAYKTVMNIVVKIEEVVLALASLMVLVLTFGNVIARKVFAHSWGFTEEIVVAVFVLIAMLAAGVAARSGELINLGLVTDNVKPRARKVLHVISSIICLIYSALLTYEGIGRMMADKTLSPILHIPKVLFWSFIVIGGVSLILHFIENCIDVLREPDVEPEDDTLYAEDLDPETLKALEAKVEEMEREEKLHQEEAAKVAEETAAAAEEAANAAETEQEVE